MLLPPSRVLGESSRWFLFILVVTIITGHVVGVDGSMEETDTGSWLIRGYEPLYNQQDVRSAVADTRKEQDGINSYSFENPFLHYKRLTAVGNKNKRNKQHRRRTARGAAAPSHGETATRHLQPGGTKVTSRILKKSHDYVPYDIFDKTASFSKSKSKKSKRKKASTKSSRKKSKSKKASSSKKKEEPESSPKKSSSSSKSSQSYSKGKGKGYHPGKGKGKGLAPTPAPSILSWQLIPPVITGNAVGDEAGRSVSYSSDGKVMAIGLPGSRLDGATSTGLVRVYRIDRKSKSWVQFGQDIRQPQSDRNTPSRFGQAIDLDHRGFQIAISAPGYFDNRGIVYAYLYLDETNRWETYGDIVVAGTDSGEEMGSSISMSGLGDVMAVGAPKKRQADSGDVDAGQVVVRYLDIVAFEWKQFGRQQEFTGAAAGDECGTAVSLASDGFAIAFGCPGSDRAFLNAGTVFAFETTDGLGGNSTWTPYGEPINGAATGEHCGMALDLSELGNIIAYGCPQNDNSFVGSTAGVVRVSEFGRRDSWQHLGKDIQGDNTGAVGSSLSLSGFGNVLAYYQSPLLDNGEAVLNTYIDDDAAYVDDDGGFVSPYQSDVLFDGKVKILVYNGAEFVQVGQTIEIDGLERFPFALDLTRDGLSINIGAVGSNDPGRIQALRLADGPTPSPTPTRKTVSPSTRRTNSPTRRPTTQSPTRTPSQTMTVAPTAPSTRRPTAAPSRTFTPTVSLFPTFADTGIPSSTAVPSATSGVTGIPSSTAVPSVTSFPSVPDGK